MDGLRRFDIAEHRGVAMVVIESDFLPPDPAIVVIPLLLDYPAVRRLNPEIVHGERRLVLATRLIAACGAPPCIAWAAPKPRATRSCAPSMS